MRNEYTGDILAVRAVEDCIRATKRYTEGVFSRRPQYPVQGEDFPSRTLTHHYDIYPLMDVGWDMSIFDAPFWLAGETPHVDVVFRYSYSTGKAHIIIQGGDGVVQLLDDNIPGFHDAFACLARCDDQHRQLGPVAPEPPIVDPIEPVAAQRRAV